MRKTVCMFWTILCHSLLSRVFFFSCLGLFCLNVLSVYQEIHILGELSTSVIYLYEISSYVNFWVLFLLLAALPSSTLYFNDCSHHYLRPLLLRVCSRRKYAVILVLVCFISSFLVVLIGEFLFLAFLRLWFPSFLEKDVIGLGLNSTIYQSFLTQNRIVWYFGIRCIDKAICGSFFSIAALFTSTFSKNKYVIITSPLVLYYLLENITVFLRLPTSCQIATLAKGHFINNDNIGLTILYPMFFFLCFSMVVSFLFIGRLGKAIENE